MDKLPINITDLILLGILLISGVLAFSRGFVREVLSIGGWLGAGLITLEAYPHTRPFVRQYISEPLLADLAGAVVVFIVSLVILWAIASAISRRVQASEIGALDRSLGFLFGIARGVVVICLAYLVLVQFVPPEEHPDWLANARATPVIRYGAQVLVEIVPSNLREGLETVEKAGTGANATINQAIDAGKAIQKLQGQIPLTDKQPDSGYTPDQRKQLDRVIRNTTDN
jgi:membrane protein required for colicin V production